MEYLDIRACCTRAKEVWDLPSQHLPGPAHPMLPCYSICSSPMLDMVVLQGCLFLECQTGSRVNSWSSAFQVILWYVWVFTLEGTVGIRIQILWPLLLSSSLLIEVSYFLFLVLGTHPVIPSPLLRRYFPSSQWERVVRASTMHHNLEILRKGQPVIKLEYLISFCQFVWCLFVCLFAFCFL